MILKDLDPYKQESAVKSMMLLIQCNKNQLTKNCQMSARKEKDYRDPLIEIMKFWVSRTNIPADLEEGLFADQIYYDLPILPSKIVDLIEEQMKNGANFKDSLLSVGFIITISPETLSRIRKRFSSSNLHDGSVVLLCFLFVCWISSRKNQNSIVDINFYLSTLNKIAKTTYQDALNEAFVAICDYICEQDDDIFFTALFSQIIQQVYINTTLQPCAFGLLVKLGNKAHAIKDDTIITNYLCLLESIIRFNTYKFTPEELSSILVTAEPSFIDLNPIAISIFAYSSKISMSKVIIRNFTMIDNFVIQKIRKSKIRLTNEDFTTVLPFSESNFLQKSSNTDGFPIPPQSVVGIDNNKLLSFHWTLESTISQIKLAIDLASDEVLDIISQTFFVSVQYTLGTDLYPDFIIFIIYILQTISKHKKIAHKFMKNLFDTYIFNPSGTIFHGDLHDCQQFARNAAIHLASDERFLAEVIQHVAHNTLILSEILTRVIYILDTSSVQNLKSDRIESYIVGGLLMGPKNLPDNVNIKITRGVPLKFLFDMLNEDEILHSVFHNAQMLSVILSLLFEEEIIDPLISVLSRAMQKSDELPEHYIKFIKSIFSQAQLKIEYEQTSLIFLSTTLRAITQNPSIAKSFQPLFDDSLDIILKNPTVDLLNMIISVFSLISQTTEFVIDKTRLYKFVSIFRALYSNNPPENMITRILGMITKSVNMSIAEAFHISLSSAVTLLMIVFSNSDSLRKVMEIILNLCQYSEQNCKLCHDANVDILIAKGILGKFTFYNIDVEFKLDEDILDIFYKIVSLISSIKSSSDCANAVVNCILPDNDGKFHDRTLRMLTMLNNIFSNYSLSPEPQYNCCSQAPSLEYKSEDPLINDGFLFAFWVRADIQTLCTNMNMKYTIMKISDIQDFAIELYIQGEHIHMVFDNDMITSSSLSKDLKPFVWNFVVVTVNASNKDAYMVTASVSHKICPDISYRAITLQGPVTFSFGFSNNDDPQKSVTLGPFAFSSALSQRLETVTSNGLESVYPHANFTDKNCETQLESFSREFSIVDAFGCVDAMSLLNIFLNAKDAPPHVLEFSLVLFGHMSICPLSVGVKTVENGYKIVKEKFPFAEDFKVNKFCKLEETGVLAIFYLLFINFIPFPYSLFSPLMSVFNHVKSVELQCILFNLFIWGGVPDIYLRRIVDNWPSIDCVKPNSMIIAELLLMPNISKIHVFRALELMLKQSISKEERNVLIGAAIEDTKNAAVYARFLRLQNAKPCRQLLFAVHDEETFVELYKLVDGMNTEDERIIKSHLAVSLFQKMDSEISFEDPDIIAIKSIILKTPIPSFPFPDIKKSDWHILPIFTAASYNSKDVLISFIIKGLSMSSNILSDFVDIICALEAASFLGLHTWSTKCAVISRLFFAIIGGEISIDKNLVPDIIEISMSALLYKPSSTIVSENLQMLINEDDSGIVDEIYKTQKFEIEKFENEYDKILNTNLPKSMSIKYQIDVTNDDANLLGAFNNIAAGYCMFQPIKPRDVLIHNFITKQKIEIGVTPNFNCLFDPDSPDRIHVRMDMSNVLYSIEQARKMLNITNVTNQKQIRALSNAKSSAVSMMSTMLECGKVIVDKYTSI